MEDERLFLAIVQTGGFSAAARMAGTTQSRVSRAVARLERRLGVTLLRRSSRRVEVTATGEAYARGLNRITRDIGTLEATLRDSTGMTGPLRVTSPPALTRRLLASGFAEFCSAYPGVQLVMDLKAQRRDLIEDGFDLAVRYGPLTETWRRATLLLRGHYHLYAPPALADIEMSEQALSKVPCLVFQSTHLRNRWPAIQKKRMTWVEVKPAHLFDDIDLLIECAGKGMGVAVLPNFLVRGEVARGELIRITRTAPVAEVFAVTEAQSLPLVRALIPYLRKSTRH
ncbi:MAG: LysR family transcriptional regulator [Myxococcota bacterium]